MNHTVKRITSVFLATVTAIVMMSQPAFSDEATEGQTQIDEAAIQAALEAQQLAAAQIEADRNDTIEAHRAYMASHPNMTPEEYMILMNANPYFNLKAYMYYNEDLMSKFTYSYWKYYQHYLTSGYKSNRACVFPPEDDYNTVTLGRYSTKYNYKIARGDNLTLACNYMNGTIIPPGGAFSYNNAVGQRTSARGFKVAHVYSGGQVVDGIGGGICQISSTLYVAMMIAQIPATEHHFHSLPVSYLKPNLDATVSWGKLDLTFINPYNFPIMILAEAKDGIATICICKAPSDN